MLPIFHMITGAPKAVAPLSHAVEIDGWLFVTGQIPTDPSDSYASLPMGVDAQTRRVMDNLKIVLEGVGINFESVVFARIYLTNFNDDYSAMNSAYVSYFAPGRYPARTCVGVTGLAGNALVEIDFIAKRPSI